MMHTYQSSTHNGADSSMAVDGNYDTNYLHRSCTHSRTESNPYWFVDLGRVYNISYVTITNRDAGAYS